MKKRCISIAAIALALIVSLAVHGCSGKYSLDSANNENFANNAIKGAEMYDSAVAEADYSNGYMNYGYNLAENEAEAEVPAVDYYDVVSESSQTQHTQVEMLSSKLPADRKIIRDANLTIEVDTEERSAEDAYNSLLSYMESLGGYESQRNMSGLDEYTTIHATIKIPSWELDAFLEEAKSAGKILNSYITSSDVTDEYFDSQTRLNTLEKTLQKYYEFLDNAEDVDEQLKVTRQINDITYEIENLKGRLKKWDALVEYSTVTIYIRCKQIPLVVEKREIKWSSLSFDDMKYLMWSGLVGVSSTIVNAVQRVIIVAVSGLPIIIPIGLIVFFALRVRKRRINDAKNRQSGYDNNGNEVNNSENHEKSDNI